LGPKYLLVIADFVITEFYCTFICLGDSVALNELRAKAKSHEDALPKYTDVEIYEEMLNQVSISSTIIFLHRSSVLYQIKGLLPQNSFSNF